MKSIKIKHSLSMRVMRQLAISVCFWLMAVAVRGQGSYEVTGTVVAENGSAVSGAKDSRSLSACSLPRKALTVVVSLTSWIGAAGAAPGGAARGRVGRRLRQCSADAGAEGGRGSVERKELVRLVQSMCARLHVWMRGDWSEERARLRRALVPTTRGRPGRLRDFDAADQRHP